jgi:Zn finger protein HypA/HybF involved in hydrogenase expression
MNCEHIWATRDIEVNSGRPYCQACGLDWQLVFKAAKPSCEFCNDSRIEFVNGGNGNVLEIECSMCAANPT